MTVPDIASAPVEDAPGRQISLLRELATLAAAAGDPPARRRRDDGWLDRWLDTCSDLARLQDHLRRDEDRHEQRRPGPEAVLLPPEAVAA